jgi:hypothetical protein
MITIASLALALLARVPDYIAAGKDIYDSYKKLQALHDQPTPATQEELAAFKVEMDAEHATLLSMTAELNAPSTGDAT